MVGGLEDGPRASQLMESYAFCRSIKHMYRGFPCLLHQCANRKQVVCTTSSTATGFHTIQDSFCEDLVGGTEEGNVTIIITDGTAAFLVKWN